MLYVLYWSHVSPCTTLAMNDFHCHHCHCHCHCHYHVRKSGPLVHCCDADISGYTMLSWIITSPCHYQYHVILHTYWKRMLSMMLKSNTIYFCHDDVIEWKHLPRYWSFVWEFTGPRWIPLTKASDAELLCFLDLCMNKKVEKNNRHAGDLRRHRAHYDVTVMVITSDIDGLLCDTHIYPSMISRHSNKRSYYFENDLSMTVLRITLNILCISSLIYI